MKKDIHPDYHDVVVVYTDGTEFKTKSTFGKEGARIQLDVDIKNHPAWNGGGTILNKKKGKAADFNNKFGAINFSTKKKAASPEKTSTAESSTEEEKK